MTFSEQFLGSWGDSIKPKARVWGGKEKRGRGRGRGRTESEVRGKREKEVKGRALIFTSVLELKTKQ